MPLERVVIVGASAAGLSAAETLREEGFKGELIMIGEELHAAYDRPPLSKDVLLGKMTAEQTRLRPQSMIDELKIQLRSGVRATALDAAAKILTLDGDEKLSFDGLIIATGLKPRLIPGQPELEGLHTLRTLDDALSLREDLLQSKKVLVIGAGFLGCEVAATAQQLGLDVVLLDSLELPMLRQVGPDIARLISNLHTSRGVEVRCDAGVKAFTQAGGRVTGVELADGSHVDADVVVVAIGSIPATGWLAGSGLGLDNGVMCDAYCRAADGIYAAGDVANWFHPEFKTRMRLEHRMNATEQGMAAAQNLLGANEAFAPVPYFWTDIYDVKVQGYGKLDAGAVMTPLTGTAGEAGFVAAYTSGGVISAVLGWNAPRVLRQARILVHKPAAELESIIASPPYSRAPSALTH